MREEMAGGCRRLQNEELRNLYTSQNVNTVTKQREMRWAAYAARMDIRIQNVRRRTSREEITRKT
jgi:hypothetical protein